jgi:hypothetical protein
MSALSWISHVAQIGTPMPFSQTQQSPGEQPRRGVILLVEDNRGDQLLTQEALKESGVAQQVLVVCEGNTCTAGAALRIPPRPRGPI